MVINFKTREIKKISNSEVKRKWSLSYIVETQYCGEDWSLPPIWQDEARIRMYLFFSLRYNIIMYKIQP
jgi:hypothetical protein